MVYKVLNMDVFLTQTHRFTFDTSKAFINPPEPCGAFFMMDRCTLLDFKIFIAIIKLRRARTFFNITMIVFVQKKKAIYTGLKASKLWGNFHFCVNYPFNASAHQDILDNASFKNNLGKALFYSSMTVLLCTYCSKVHKDMVGWLLTDPHRVLT